MESIKPLVSICIPTYNGDQYLEQALKTIKNQSYRPIEVIFSDDDSRDRTISIIKEFKKFAEFPVNIYYHNPSSIGANWNNCVKHAQGEYIKFLFQDDLLHPDCLNKLVALAEKNKKIGMVYCRRSILYEKNNQQHLNWISIFGDLNKYWNFEFETSSIVSGKNYLKDRNINQKPENKIGEPTAVLLRREVFQKTGYFHLELKQLLDIEFWLRIMKYYKIAYLDETLVSFRLHANQASSTNKKFAFWESMKFKKILYDDYFWYLNNKVKIELFKMFGVKAIREYLKI